jgi:hypothetical protein
MWEIGHNIAMDVKEMCCDIVDWSEMAQYQSSMADIFKPFGSGRRKSLLTGIFGSDLVKKLVN